MTKITRENTHASIAPLAAKSNEKPVAQSVRVLQNLADDLHNVQAATGGVNTRRSQDPRNALITASPTVDNEDRSEDFDTIRAKGKSFKELADQLVSAKSQPLSVPRPPPRSKSQLVLLLSALSLAAGQTYSAQSNTAALTVRSYNSSKPLHLNISSRAPRVRRQSPVTLATRKLDQATLQIISERWTDQDFLVDHLEHHQRQVQNDFLKEQEQVGPDKERISKLSQELNTIEDAKRTILMPVSRAKKAEAFNTVFSDAIKQRDIRTQNVLDDAYSPEDLYWLYDEAYPVTTNPAALFKSCLSKIFREHGETNLSPDALVKMETFSYSTWDSGLHSMGIKEDTLLRIALGNHYKALWNGHLEVKGLPRTIARLFYKPRYFGGYTFPITRLLNDGINAAITKLQDPNAIEARKILWRGKIMSALANYFYEYPEAHALKDALQYGAGIYTLRFNFGSGGATLNNIVAIKGNTSEFILINVITSETCVVRTDIGGGYVNHERLKKIIPAAINLKSALYTRSRSDLEFMFAKQKPFFKRWHRLTSYQNPGEVFFYQENVSINEAAAALEDLDIETLKSDADFLTVIESEVQKHALVDGVEMALTKLSIATSAPLLGWTPAILGISLMVAPPAIRYVLDQAMSKDQIDRSEAQERLYTSMYELVVYGAAANGGMYAILTTRRFVKKNNLKHLLGLGLSKNGKKENLPVEVPSKRGPQAKSAAKRTILDDEPGNQPYYEYPKSESFTTLFRGDETFLRLYRGDKRVVHYRTVSGTDYVHLTTFSGSGYDRSRTLLLTAHGGFVPTDLGKQLVRIPFNTQVEFYTPHGMQLSDPGLYYILNSVTEHRTYAVFHSNALQKTVMKKRPTFLPQRDNPDWKMGADYDGYSLEAIMGRPEGLMNYRHIHYEHDTPLKAAESLLANRRSKVVENTDILLINGDVTEKWQTDPSRNSVQRVLDLVSSGDIINPGPEGETYTTVKFLHCRNDFTTLQTLLSAYNMRVRDFGAFAPYQRQFKSQELWAIGETIKTRNPQPVRRETAANRWITADRLLAIRFLYRSNEPVQLTSLLSDQNMQINKIVLPDTLNQKSWVLGIFDITLELPPIPATNGVRGNVTTFSRLLGLTIADGPSPSPSPGPSQEPIHSTPASRP